MYLRHQIFFLSTSHLFLIKFLVSYINSYLENSHKLPCSLPTRLADIIPIDFQYFEYMKDQVYKIRHKIMKENNKIFMDTRSYGS